MSDAVWQDLLKIVSDHPLVAAWLGLLFFLSLLLGIVHVCRLFGECLIVFIRHFKCELVAARNVGRRLKDELTTWKVDE
jgi:hypothetical protein